jgi:hypothetical protein
LLEPVIDCLSHPDRCVRTEAAWAASLFGGAAAVAVPQLLALLDDDYHGAWDAAAYTLGSLRVQPEVVVPALARLVCEREYIPLWEPIDALGAYGRDATPALPKLLERFALAVANNDDLVTPIARALEAICQDPRQAVRDHIGSRDPELLQLALRELANVADAPGHAPPIQGVIPYPRPQR